MNVSGLEKGKNFVAGQTTDCEEFNYESHGGIKEMFHIPFPQHFSRDDHKSLQEWNGSCSSTCSLSNAVGPLTFSYLSALLAVTFSRQSSFDSGLVFSIDFSSLRECHLVQIVENLVDVLVQNMKLCAVLLLFKTQIRTNLRLDCYLLG